MVPGHIAVEKKVEVGQTIGANVIIKGGLAEGDKIIVDGVQSLHDGSRIALGPGKKAAGDSTQKKDVK
jgi:multidrug efflux pump subunit AcrA (membrane-fusion protein)